MVEYVHEFGFEKEIEDKMIRVFNESMEYNPEKSTYSSEKYQHNREYHLKKSGGERGYQESKMKAANKYNEKTRRNSIEKKEKDIIIRKRKCNYKCNYKGIYNKFHYAREKSLFL